MCLFQTLGHWFNIFLNLSVWHAVLHAFIADVSMSNFRWKCKIVSIVSGIKFSVIEVLSPDFASFFAIAAAKTTKVKTPFLSAEVRLSYSEFSAVFLVRTAIGGQETVRRRGEWWAATPGWTRKPSGAASRDSSTRSPSKMRTTR